MKTGAGRHRTSACQPSASACQTITASALSIAAAILLSGTAPRAEGVDGARSQQCPACPADGVRGGEDLTPAGPHALAVDAGVGFGFFYATHSRWTFSFGRRFWDRLAVELAFRVDLGRGMLGLEEVALVGLILHHSRRWDVLIGGRTGIASFRLEMPGGARWYHTPVVTGLVEIRHLLTKKLELRITPAAITAYFGDMWGVGVEPGLGLALRL